LKTRHQQTSTAPDPGAKKDAVSLGDILTQVRRSIRSVPNVSATESEQLVSAACSFPVSTLYAHPELPLPHSMEQRIMAWLDARRNSVPLAYLTGSCEFWSLPVKVNPETLIPRPETELLVEQALMLLEPNQPALAADLGTGSGAIALALAHERPQCVIDATDISSPALAMARHNADQLDLAQRIRFHEGDWCAALFKKNYDLIISNPPYIAANDPHLPALRHEPHHALVSGNHGLYAIETILDQARRYLRPNGWLLIEHGYDQGPQVFERAIELGYIEVQTIHDLADHPRVCKARWPVLTR